MPAPPSHAVAALVFYVADLDRTHRFYTDVLGLDLERMDLPDHPGMLTGEVGPVSLVFFEDTAHSPGRSPVVVFALDGGIDDAVDALIDQNVEIVAPVAEAPDGGLTADFLDPDGHLLSFHQPAGQARRHPSAL